MEALIDASFAENILLDGAVHDESVEAVRVGGGGGLPLGGRDNLREKSKGKKPEGVSGGRERTLTMPKRDL